MDTSAISRFLSILLAVVAFSLPTLGRADDGDAEAADGYTAVRATWASSSGEATDGDRARKEALGKALLRALTRWMATGDLKREYKLIRNSFLSEPEKYLSDIKAYEITKQGGRIYGQNFQVLPNFDALEKELLRVGLLMPWKQSPHVRTVSLMQDADGKLRLADIDVAALKALWRNLGQLEIVVDSVAPVAAEAAAIQKALEAEPEADRWQRVSKAFTTPTDYIAFSVARPESRSKEVAGLLPPSPGDIEIRLYRVSPWTELTVGQMPRFSSPFEQAGEKIRILEEGVTGHMLMSVTSVIADDWFTASKKHRYGILVDEVTSAKDALDWFELFVDQRTIFHQLHPAEVGRTDSDKPVQLRLQFYSTNAADDLLAALQVIAKPRGFVATRGGDQTFLIRRAKPS